MAFLMYISVDADVNKCIIEFRNIVLYNYNIKVVKFKYISYLCMI